MTELECPHLYEDGVACGSCDYCRAVAYRDATLYGHPSDYDTP